MARSARHRWHRNRWFKRIRRRRRGHTRGRRRYQSKQGIYNFKFRATYNLSVTKDANQGYFTYTLASIVPAEFRKYFDMYRILKVRAQFLPMGAITDHRPWGATVLDLTGRDTALVGKGEHDFTIDDTTRRLWNPTRLHSRYFTPKPDIRIVTNGEGIQPNSVRNQLWLNTKFPEIKHHGLAYFFEAKNIGESTYKFLYTTTIYMQFRQFAGSLAP
nr:capsid protein [WigFec circovirus 2]